MSTKLVLDIAAMKEEFFSDSALIGIASTLPFYRFCWLLNHRLDMNFVREPEMDVIVQHAGKQHFFPIYQYCIPLNGCRHLMYKLKTDKEVLLPEVKQLDYLWLIQSMSAEEDANLVTRHLRNIPEIQLAQALTADKLKNVSNLIV